MSLHMREQIPPPPEAEPRGTTVPPARSRPPRRRGGTYRPPIPAGAPGQVLLVAIPIVAVALILLSILGTFYGIQGDPAPLGRPGQLLRDLWAGWPMLPAAVGVQFGLGMAQWGGRSLAEDHLGWWALYALSLALSVWLNWIAYGVPLVALGMPWLIALALIVIGDILPEIALVRGRS